MFFAVVVTPLALVFGQNSSPGVEILQVTPSSLTGSAGQPVNVQGTIYNSNGAYNVILGTEVVANGTAEGYYVNANFTVPQMPWGSYSLTLQDVSNNINSTGATPETFTVTTGYNITATPSQAQEGSTILLNVTVTSVTPGSSNTANVTVVLPSPLSTGYSTVIPLGTANQEGTANAQVSFPNSSFTPSGSITDYVGVYTVYFNLTGLFAQTQFTIGFLNSTTYHRGDTATILATGYQSNQTATLSITNTVSNAPVDSQSLTASDNGTISTTWVVTSNIAIGTYNATITTTQGTPKAINDSETFSVPGYSIQVTTVNIANEVVPQIEVQALDPSTNLLYNSTTADDGIAELNLEAGPASLTAFWNGVNVGETNIIITGNAAFTLTCQLTDLKITVQNENGLGIPLVNLVITYQYQPTNGGSSQMGNISVQTDSSGTYTLNSTLPGIGYTINASLYNIVFNSANNTISTLPAQALSEAVIICPNEPLTINVVGYNQAAIPDARIDLVELTSGIFYTATTNSSGSATSHVTFGTYRLQIYKDSILINETTVEVFSDIQQQICCTLYGIQVSVSVVDFFGQPINNANVTLSGPATERFSAITQGDGTATFNNVIGGDMQIVAFAQGEQSNYQAVSLIIDQPTSIQIKMDNYIGFGSLLMPVSLLITIIIIIVAVVLLVTVEIYSRKRLKHTTES